MKIDQQKDVERFGLSLAIAIFVHITVFLIVEYGDLLVFEEYQGYIGPMSVGFEEPIPASVSARIEEPGREPTEMPPADVTPDTVEELTLEEALTGENTAETTAEEPAPEEPAPDETPQEDAPAEVEAPVPIGEPDPQDTPAETAEVTDEAGETDLKLPEKSRLPESTPEPILQEKTVPREVNAPPDEIPDNPPQPAPYIQDDSKHSGRDNEHAYAIQMDEKSHKARPAFRIPVVLPDGIDLEGKQLKVVVSFVVGPDGKVIALEIEQSCGNDSVDRAVARAMMPPDGNGWSFSNPSGQDRILGKITYRINAPAAQPVAPRGQPAAQPAATSGQPTTQPPDES